MSKVLLINGPPNSGKDEVAKIVNDKFDHAKIYKFAYPIKNIMRTMFELSDEEFSAIDAPIEKEKPSELLFGKSSREVQIEISEKYMKPAFGKDIFGKMLVKKLQKEKPEVVIVSDSGFVEEARCLYKYTNASDITIVRLHRDGCNFKNDSRSYIELDGVVSFDVYNNGTIEQLSNQIYEIIAYRLDLFE